MEKGIDYKHLTVGMRITSLMTWMKAITARIMSDDELAATLKEMERATEKIHSGYTTYCIGAGIPRSGAVDNIKKQVDESYNKVFLSIMKDRQENGMHPLAKTLEELGDLLTDIKPNPSNGNHKRGPVS